MTRRANKIDILSPDHVNGHNLVRILQTCCIADDTRATTAASQITPVSAEATSLQ